MPCSDEIACGSKITAAAAEKLSPSRVDVIVGNNMLEISQHQFDELKSSYQARVNSELINRTRSAFSKYIYNMSDDEILKVMQHSAIRCDDIGVFDNSDRWSIFSMMLLGGLNVENHEWFKEIIGISFLKSKEKVVLLREIFLSTSWTD